MEGGKYSMYPGLHQTLLGFCVLEYVWGRRAAWKLVLEQEKDLGTVQLKKDRLKGPGLSGSRESRSLSPLREKLGLVEEATVR